MAMHTRVRRNMPKAGDEDNSLGPDDIVIAVMGCTGVGKSTFINYLSDEDVVVGHSLESCTSEVSINVATRLPDRLPKIYLVDTPGFDDTHRSDTDVLKDLASWLNKAYDSNIKLAGIVYLHRISDRRLTGAGMKNLRMFKKLCGQEGLGCVVLATTMWDDINEVEGARREEELKQRPDFWKTMIDNGSQVFRHDRDVDSALDIVTYLLRKRRKVVIQIQKEMANGMSLDETAAGKEVQAEIEKARAMYEKKLADIREEMEEARRNQDREHQKELEEHRREVEGKMRQNEEDMHQLRVGRAQLEQQLQQYQAQNALATQRLEQQSGEIQKMQHELHKQRQRHQEDREEWEGAQEQARAQDRQRMQELERQLSRQSRQSTNAPTQYHQEQPRPQFVFVPQPYVVQVPVQQPRRSGFGCTLM